MSATESTKPELQKGKPTQTEITAKTIIERYNTAVKATKYEATEYWKNDAYLSGRQWIYVNTQTNRIDDIARTRGRVQATIDRLSPSTRTLMAYLLQRPLTFETRPSAADQDTIQKARTSQAAVRQIQRKHDWAVLDEELAWGTWKGGYGALCVDWDTGAGDYIDDDLFTGDTCETVLTAPEFVIEPGARRAEKARYWHKALVLPQETAQAMYGLEKLPPNDAQSTMSPYNSRAIRSDSDTINQTDGTLVITYYERPNPMNPKGSVAVVIDGKLVESKPWPFPFKDRLNLVVMRETPLNGKWTGETILSKATKVQVALNAAWTNYLEHLKSVGQARLMLPASQSQLADVLEDNPGKPITYLDGPGAALPGYLQPPQMPSWVINSIQELRNEMDGILGVPAIMRGVAPVNIDSGDGLQVLQQAAATPVDRAASERARVWGEFASLVLKIVAVNVKDTRKAIIQTGNEPPMTVPWTGKDLGEETEVTVPVDAIRPKSQAAQWMLAKEMLQMNPQWFSGPADFMAVAELQDADDILWMLDVQTAKARRVAHFLAEGIYIKPEIRDDHKVFIRELTNFMQTPRFDELAPDVRQLFEFTVDGHQRFAEEQMAQQQAKAMLSPALAAVPNAAGAPTLPLPEPPQGINPGEGPAAPATPGAPQQTPQSEG